MTKLQKKIEKIRARIGFLKLVIADHKNNNNTYERLQKFVFAVLERKLEKLYIKVAKKIKKGVTA
jgi:hypothetical protein